MRALLVLPMLMAVMAVALGKRRVGIRLIVLVAVGAFVVSSIPARAPRVSDPSTAPNPAPAATYVAIGDSYASGEGTGSYFAATDRPRSQGAAAPRNLCRRSPIAYPYLVLGALERRGDEPALRDVACSGATTGDLLDHWQFTDTPPQVEALDPVVRVITIQVGGNDLGFGAVLDRCVDVKIVHERTPCAEDVRSRVATESATVAGALDRAFGAVRLRAPNATVLVLGYPLIFELDELPIGTKKRCAHVRRDDVIAIIEANVALNRLVEDAASRLGLTFLPLDRLFDDHGLCGRSDDWINGMTLDLPRRSERTISTESVSPVSRDSFHPSPRAHEAIAEAVVSGLDVIEGRSN